MYGDQFGEFLCGSWGLICKRLFRALDKMSLFLKINVLIKLVLWSFFGSKKGWQIIWAPPASGVGGGVLPYKRLIQIFWGNTVLLLRLAKYQNVCTVGEN